MKIKALGFRGYALASIIFIILMSMTAFSGEWKLYNKGWYYIGDDGKAVKDQWVGNYYLGSDGIMVTSTWTPDGYYVGEDGAWDGKPARTNITISPLEGTYKYAYTKCVGMDPYERNEVGLLKVINNQDGTFTAQNSYVSVILKPLKDGTYSGRTDFDYYHLDSSGLFIEFGDGADFYKKEA